MTPSSSALPAHPTLVAVDLGDGPQVRRLTGDGGAQTLDLKPRVTDTVTVSILDWDDVIDRTALGFDQLKPPGLAEVDGARRRRRPDRRRRRRPQPRPQHRPAAAAAARSSASPAGSCTPRSAPRSARCWTANRWPPGRAGRADRAARRPAGAADQPRRRVRRRRRPAGRPAGRSNTARGNGSRADRDLGHRSVARCSVPASATVAGAGRSREHQPRLDGAHRADGARLTPVAVNGWQQGWVVPPGTEGTVTLTFASNSLYRAGLSAAWRCCRCWRCWPSCRRAGAPSRTTPTPVWARAPGQRRGAGGGGGDLRSGGRRRGRRRARAAVCAAPTAKSSATPSRSALTAGGLILAGAVLQPEPVAIGRRIRRALRGGAVARPRLGGDAGGLRRARESRSFHGRGRDRALASARCRN